MSENNTFGVRRAAHRAVRKSNLYRLGGRARTFSNDQRDLEAQDSPAVPGPGDGSPVEHAQTHTGVFGRDTDIQEEGGERLSKDAEARDFGGAEKDPVGSGRSLLDNRSITGASDGNVGLRARQRKATESTGATGKTDESDEKETKKSKKESRFLKHVEPKEPFTVANQLHRTLLNTYLNILLLAVPIGIAVNFVPTVPGWVVFLINFIAIIPLAAMLSFATEEIALRTGESLGGLLNATFGNAVELIVAVIALADSKYVIVKTSLVGSILSNLLLVLGMCFFFGGLRRQEQYFNITVAQTAASLLALAVAGVIVPTVFDQAQNTPAKQVAGLSRGTAIILLIVYGAYLFFQLKTHHTIFSEESQKVPAKPFRTPSAATPSLSQGLVNPGMMMAHGVSDQEQLQKMLVANHPNHEANEDEEEDDEEEPQLNFIVALATLAISTAFIALCAEFMVDSIDAITGSISEEFVGLILLPIVGNAAEHATAVTVAIKDKMDLAIGVAVGSSMQVALFIIPLLVVIGWGMGVDEMSLSFDNFQVAVLFVSVLLVNYLIADGKSHWLEGMLLICLYAIIAVCSWYYPNEAQGGNTSS